MSLWGGDGRYLGGVIGSVDGLVATIAKSEIPARGAGGG